MENWLSLVILTEVTLTLLVAWGWMHEDKFIAFERRAWRAIRRFWRKYNPVRVIAALIWAIRIEIAERIEF